MAFFDDLGRKISQAGQTAVQKTKDVADVSRINSAISEEEKRINNNYYQIGKLYVAMHASDCEPDFAGMISVIKESEIKIHDYKQQIQDIKGVVMCEKCGAEIPNNVLFCSTCGSPVSKQENVIINTDLVRCTACGKMVSKNIRFCTGCGKAMADIVQSQPVPQQVQPQQVNIQSNQSNAEPIQSGVQHSQSNTQQTQNFEQLQKANAGVNQDNIQAEPVFEWKSKTFMTPDNIIKRCPNCGEEISEELAFCTRCGTKL